MTIVDRTEFLVLLLAPLLLFPACGGPPSVNRHGDGGTSANNDDDRDDRNDRDGGDNNSGKDPNLSDDVIEGDDEEEDDDNSCPFESCDFGDAGTICGDGVRDPGEECDDGNFLAGDGCTGACTIEPFHECSEAGEACVSTIECGNNMLEPGEQCDDDNTTNGDGCSASCTLEAGWVCPAGQNCVQLYACGDGRVSAAMGEQCEDGNTQSGDGCNADCQLEVGYACPTPGQPCQPIIVCGNGLREAGEQCDDGNALPGDGCNNICRIEADWECEESATCDDGLPCSSVCTHHPPVCGDGIINGDEICDDGNSASGDGCDAECDVEDGYRCPRAGFPCLTNCGDGIVMGGEQCDVGDSVDASDTTACVNCRLQPGFTCGEDGVGPCTQTVCGNGDPDDPIGAAESGEGCDDGNQIAGDGCGPTCQLEPRVTVGPDPIVHLTCGDGLKTSDEECDDGNTVDGDGCSAGCEIEEGWICEDVLTLPDTVQMAVTYRDFKANAASGGHPHFQNVNNNNKGIPGLPCTTENQDTCGRLDDDGKPQLVGTHSSITGGMMNAPRRFGLWFRDEATDPNDEIDIEVIPGSLTLSQIGGANSDVYEYNDEDYFPLNDLGHGNTCGNEINPTCCDEDGECVGRNFHFTSELRYFFQYQGGETLIFRGDDDVWVFINGRLAVDVGGVHCAQIGRVILGDESSSCSEHGTDYTGNCATTGDPPDCSLSTDDQNDDTDDRFGITKGGVYEIVLFHAERHTSQSNFHLTLQGFLAPRTFCSTVCGDGIVTPDEECDDGTPGIVDEATHEGPYNTVEPEYNRCTDNGSDLRCVLGPYCGDGTLDTWQTTTDPDSTGDAGTELEGEVCDNGSNTSRYNSLILDENACAPGCVPPPYCGDGIINGSELCDDADANTLDGYNGCKTDCTPGPRCGDTEIDEEHGETCDDGINDGRYGSCTPDCQEGPRCGDGIVQEEWGEQCDGGENCSANCRIGAQCGDGVVQPELGEECDDGINEGGYGKCGPGCRMGPYCGDGVRNGTERCDDGENTGAYGKCAPGCVLGPYCGDGNIDAPDEECDGTPDCFFNCKRIGGIL